MDDNQDVLKRAYANLLSLKDNLPRKHPNYPLEAATVKLYMDQLDKLEAVGINVSDFRIPAEMLTPEMVSANYLTNEMVAAGQTGVSESYLRTKLDALLTYFQLSTPPNEKPSIGFHA